MNSNRIGETIVVKNYLYIPVVLFLFILLPESKGFAINQNFGGLIHFPPDHGVAGFTLELTAKLSYSTAQPERLLIYFRGQGATQFEFVEMDLQTESYHGFIPAEKIFAPELEYFIVATFANKKMVTSPAVNPMSEPHVVPVVEDSKSQSTGLQSPEMLIKSTHGTLVKITILSPDPGAEIQKEDVLVAVSISEMQGRLDLKKTKLIFDDKNVTTKTEISPFLITYLPHNISPGKHSVKILLTDSEEGTFKPLEWSFRVKHAGRSKLAPSKYLNGNVYFDARAENISDSSLSSLNTGANISGSIGGIHYRSSVYLTSFEDHGSQPRNRYFFEVGTRWLGLRLGDTNPLMNDLILWGNRVRGIEGDLKLGFFNLKVVQGETQRGLDGELLSLSPDPFSSDTLRTFRYGAYQRNLFAVRPSFGSGQHFQLGFNYLKAKDDIASIDIGIQPKDNIVIGSDVLFALFRRRIVFKAGVAFSLLTRDISEGSISKSQIDSLLDTEIPIDPEEFEDIFIINTSTTPLNPLELSSLAYNAEANFHLLHNSFQFQYRSIGAEYVSLGNTYLRKNIQGFSLSDRIRLLQNQLHLTLGYEHFIDGLNLKNDGNDNTKPIEIQAVNFGINYYPHILGLPTVSLNVREKNRDNGLDSLNAIGNQNQDVAIQLGYEFPFQGTNSSVQLSFIGSDRNDDFNSIAANVASDIQMLTIRTRFHIPLVTTIMYSSNGSKTGEESSKISFDYSQFGFSADYSFFRDRLRINSGIFVTTGLGKQPVDNEIVEYTNYHRTSVNLGSVFHITARQFVRLEMFFIRFEDKYTSKYNDNIFRFRYELRY